MKTCKECYYFSNEFKVANKLKTCQGLGTNESDKPCEDFITEIPKAEDIVLVPKPTTKPATKPTSDTFEADFDISNASELLLTNSIFDDILHVFKVQKATDKVLEDIGRILEDQNILLPYDNGDINKVLKRVIELYLTHNYAMKFGFAGDKLDDVVKQATVRLFGPKTGGEQILKLHVKGKAL